MFLEDAVVIRAVRLKINAPPKVGEPRFHSWDPKLEAIPPGRSALEAIGNPRRSTWSQDCGDPDDEEEDREDKEEASRTHKDYEKLERDVWVITFSNLLGMKTEVFAFVRVRADNLTTTTNPKLLANCQTAS
ncbi:MAG TPA: hypothetical protein QF753_22920 [Victivallales bacterium]|nr:hypothetical protein [Victivallales bacterium]